MTERVDRDRRERHEHTTKGNGSARYSARPLQDACHGRDDIQDAIDDIGKILVILEGYSKWPNWEATTARDA